MPIAGRASECESGGTGRGRWVERRLRRLLTAHLALTGSQLPWSGQVDESLAGWCG